MDMSFLNNDYDRTYRFNWVEYHNREAELMKKGYLLDRYSDFLYSDYEIDYSVIHNALEQIRLKSEAYYAKSRQIPYFYLVGHWSYRIKHRTYFRDYMGNNPDGLVEVQRDIPQIEWEPYLEYVPNGNLHRLKVYK